MVQSPLVKTEAKEEGWGSAGRECLCFHMGKSVKISCLSPGLEEETSSIWKNFPDMRQQVQRTSKRNLLDVLETQKKKSRSSGK